MLMMCWFYCVPFAKGMFFAFPWLLIIFSLFVLKRGIRQSRPMLRQLAFLLMFVAVLKIFTVDLYFLKDTLLCGTRLFRAGCNATGFKILQLLGLVASVLTSLALFNAYRGFIRERKNPGITPKQARLQFWANLSLALALALTLWLAAPWVGYLTVGHVPQIFMQVPWQILALLNVAVLMTGFWKLEDCSWIYNPSERHKKKHMNRVWTPKDTLWLSLTLFLITLVFSYASSDILSTSPKHNERGHPAMNKIDLRGFSNGFHLPKSE